MAGKDRQAGRRIVCTLRCIDLDKNKAMSLAVSGRQGQ
jgi:hypothetical protein